MSKDLYEPKNIQPLVENKQRDVELIKILYISTERVVKTTPRFNYWSFDCKFGKTKEGL